MQHYLRSTKDVLRTLDCNNTELDVVLGNEACDLDSAVAALVYGFYLQSKRGVSYTITYYYVTHLLFIKRIQTRAYKHYVDAFTA